MEGAAYLRRAAAKILIFSIVTKYVCAELRRFVRQVITLAKKYALIHFVLLMICIIFAP